MTERGKALAALLRSDSNGLDDEIKRLVSRYGVEAVRSSVKRNAMLKRGRKAEKDFPLIYANAQLDAREWLEGRDPVRIRSNYSIAVSIAQTEPGHSMIATKARIEKKLRKWRKSLMYTVAADIANTEYPWPLLIQAREELARLDPIWAKILGYDQGTIARHRERFGEPDPSMTFRAIEEGLKVPPVNALLGTSNPFAMGLLSPRPT